MAEFNIKTDMVIHQAYRINDVKEVVSSVNRKLEVISNNMSSIGLENVLPLLEEIKELSFDNIKSLNSLEDNLKKIVRRYIATESNIDVFMKDGLTKEDGFLDILYDLIDYNSDGKINYVDLLLFAFDKYEKHLEFIYNCILRIDENGNVSYNMEAILAVLSMNPDMVPDYAYDAIAEAFMYMSEDEMGQVIQSMMVKEGDYAYSPLDFFLVGVTHEGATNHSVWMLDQEKYKALTDAINRFEAKNIASINYCDQVYYETRDELYYELATHASEFRRELLQRKTLMDTLGYIDEFQGDMHSDHPEINITRRDDGALVMEFLHDEEIPVLLGHDITNPHSTASITVAPCVEAQKYDLDDCEYVSVYLHSQFADGFTSSGFASDTDAIMFTLEHALGFGYSAGETYTTSQLPSNLQTPAGYALTFVDNVIDGVSDYNTGVSNAAHIEALEEHMQSTRVYTNFDCYVTSVQFDVDGMVPTGIFVDEGRYTNQIIDFYNAHTQGSPISFADISENTSDVFQGLNEYYDNGGSLSELTNVQGWPY